MNFLSKSKDNFLKLVLIYSNSHGFIFKRIHNFFLREIFSWFLYVTNDIIQNNNKIIDNSEKKNSC